MSEAETLGQLVRAKRQREGLSLRDASDASGVAFATIGRVENGGEPSLRVDRALRAWLDGEGPLIPLPPMTLRDWFAGQALTGLLGGQFRHTGNFNFDGVPSEAYGIADAMLAERTKGNGQ